MKISRVKTYRTMRNFIQNGEENLERNCTDIPLGTISFNLNMIINNIHLRLLSYEKKTYDIEINFDLDDIQNESTMETETVLLNYALNIANRNSINHYFAGLDPAGDEETRIFTGGLLGPYSLPK